MENTVNQTNSVISESCVENPTFFDMIYALFPENNISQSHLNDVYVSSYQLAISFASHHPENYRELGLPIGGRGIDEHRSLAQYIGKILSREAAKPQPRVVGGFLSGLHVSQISFKSQDGLAVISSVYDLTIWRRNTIC